jgi:nucleoside-diphosphate-sugar epimerase
MVAFVIGGAGFIGRHVVRKLAARGEEVVCLDVMPADFTDLGAQVRQQRMDLTDFEQVMAAMATHKPEVVVNLSYMRESPPRPAMKLNILGMDNCFEAARLCDVARVVYSSSIAIHGRQAPYGPRNILETDTPHPITQYAVHKVFNEFQAKEYREKHGMCITGVRAAHVAGVDKLIGSVDHVECVVKPALGQRAVFRYRDTMRCVIHAEDMAEVFVRIACSRQPEHAIYNSGGESLSLGQLAEMVRAVLPEADIAFENESGGEERTTAYLFDNQRLIREFDMQFVPYAQRVAQMIARLRGIKDQT